MKSLRKVHLLIPLASALILSGFTGGSCDLVEEPQILPPLPPQLACEDVSENACNARGDCTATYLEACLCPACGPEGDCLPCTCEQVYDGCTRNDPCQGQDEASCLADGFCEAQYITAGCSTPDCGPGQRCPPPPPCPEGPVFSGCVEPRPVCAAIACANTCEFGFVSDREGCGTCECIPEPPPPPPTCSGVTCTLYCEFGFAADEQGCEICTCNPPPPPPPMCEPVLCELYCEYGFAVNEAGCEICSCNSAPPPPPPPCQTDVDCGEGG